MDSKDMISLGAIAAGVAIAALNTVYTDIKSRRESKTNREDKERERQRDREDKDRERQRDREDKERTAKEDWRQQLLVSLMPLVSLLSEYPLAEGASNEQISSHIHRLRSTSAAQAVQSLAFIGLVYPSPTAQMAAGYVKGTLDNVVMLEEGVLDLSDSQERQKALRATGKVLRVAEEKIRELAREIRGPLPWETSLADRSASLSTSPRPTS
jgi:hypothetical protein